MRLARCRSRPRRWGRIRCSWQSFGRSEGPGMFTGIVVEQGRVRQPPPRLVLSAPATAAGAAIGDSVAIDGCCLTVVTIEGDLLGFDAVPETLRRSTLGRLAAGDAVNLEPALRAGDRMGGHVVQG